MPSGVYQLPNLPSLCPKKTGNNISPGFQEAKDGYEQWVRENIGLFLSIVSNYRTCSHDRAEDLRRN